MVHDWPDMPFHAIYKTMSAPAAVSLPTDFKSELERRYFWWVPVGSQPRSDARILAQAMDLASFEDVRRFEAILGVYRLADAMVRAEPGWISDRSWEFWRGRLVAATGRRIPETPPRRSFDAGLF